MVLLVMEFLCLAVWSWQLSGGAVVSAGLQGPLCRGI